MTLKNPNIWEIFEALIASLMNPTIAAVSLSAIASALNRITGGKKSHKAVTTTNAIATDPETTAGNLNFPFTAFLMTISIAKHIPWIKKKHVTSHVGLNLPA